jgi:A/G-specific adenine glycosylase
LIRQRVRNDIWKNLFEFPLVEATEESSIGKLIETDEFRKIVQPDQVIIENVSNWEIHHLSHQRIHYRFIRVRLADNNSTLESLIRVNKEDIFNFAVPKLLETYLVDRGQNVLFI